MKFFSGSCVCCNHDFCMDIKAKTRHRMISSCFPGFVIKTKYNHPPWRKFQPVQVEGRRNFLMTVYSDLDVSLDI